MWCESITKGNERREQNNGPRETQRHIISMQHIIIITSMIIITFHFMCFSFFVLSSFSLNWQWEIVSFHSMRTPRISFIFGNSLFGSAHSRNSVPIILSFFTSLFLHRSSFACTGPDYVLQIMPHMRIVHMIRRREECVRFGCRLKQQSSTGNAHTS